MNVLPTKADFLNWRSPRRGQSNPERMDNPFWAWCVHSGETAFEANQAFGGPDSFSNGPCWCFQRMGQAHVSLPEGRDLYIAGEHEDYYDPDFYIFNDVVIVDGDDVAIYGYSESDFPPTDFHSASRIDSIIFLIGNLGYPRDRRPGITQVLQLDLETMRISRVETTGQNPGWIYEHKATVEESRNVIAISGGKRHTTNGSGGFRDCENFHEYELCLNTFTWQIAKRRNWQAWLLEREDRQPNHLWEIRSEEMNRCLRLSIGDEEFEPTAELLERNSPTISDVQIAAIQDLYQSPFDDGAAVEDEECYGRFRFLVGETTVRIDEDMFSVTVTFEGELPKSTRETILLELRKRLSEIERTTYSLVALNAEGL